MLHYPSLFKHWGKVMYTVYYITVISCVTHLLDRIYVVVLGENSLGCLINQEKWCPNNLEQIKVKRIANEIGWLLPAIGSSLLPFEANLQMSGNLPWLRKAWNQIQRKGNLIVNLLRKNYLNPQPWRVLNYVVVVWLLGGHVDWMDFRNQFPLWVCMLDGVSWV